LLTASSAAEEAWLIQLDHIAFGIRSAASAAETLRALGFADGPFSSCAWEIAGEPYAADAVCCVFERTYLDLIEVSDAEWNAHLASSPVYSRGLAPTGVVLSGVDPRAASEHLGGEPYWITRHLASDPPRAIGHEFLSLSSLKLPFGLVRDEAPGALRDVSPRAHPNTALGISAVHLRVASVAAVLARLEREPLAIPSATPLAIGSTQIWLHEDPRSGYLARVASLLPQTRRPALLALDFPVTSLEAAADVLQTRGVAFAASDDAISIEPGQGFGTGIVFSRPTSTPSAAAQDHHPSPS